MGFSFMRVSPNKNTKVVEKTQNTKSASLGEQKALRESYSLSPKAIQAMRPLSLDWVEWLEAMVPTYDNIMGKEDTDIHKLNHLRGMKEAAQMLRNAYITQNARKGT